MSTSHRAPSYADIGAVADNPWIDRRKRVILVAALAMLPLSLGTFLQVPGPLKGLGVLVFVLCLPAWAFCAIKARGADRY